MAMMGMGMTSQRRPRGALISAHVRAAGATSIPCPWYVLHSYSIKLHIERIYIIDTERSICSPVIISIASVANDAIVSIARRNSA
jgi:hypothetical protein